MKLIHLPTGTEIELEDVIANNRLLQHPKTYIRAALPEHWRVEGYDKSWEWANALSQTQDEEEWDWVSNKSLISKKPANAFFRGNLLQKQTQPISRAEFEYHHYNPWKKKQGKARQAEKMGYELVKKDVQWEGDNFKFDLSQEGLGITSFLTSFDSNISIRLTPHEIDTLIEKYNQLKSN